MSTKIQWLDDIRETYAVYDRPEPIRDWALGFISGHRFYVFIYLLIGITALYALQAWIWPVANTPQTLIGIIWSYGTILWVTQILPVGLGLMGLIAFEHPEQEHLDTILPIKTLVSFRIVSRGNNTEALTATINSCLTEMIRTPLFPIIVEVVIDEYNPALLPRPTAHIKYIVVPKHYQTKNHSLYKARALQYALENSSLLNTAWIVHLDEESHLTSSGIKGICAMIREEANSDELGDIL